MNVKNVSIVASITVLVFLSGIPVLSSGNISNYAYARYATNAQTQANSNECTDNTNCGITSPQTHGDGTANSPVNSQVSRFNEKQEDDGVGGNEVIFVNNCTLDAPDPRFGSIVVCHAILQGIQPIRCFVDIEPPFLCYLGDSFAFRFNCSNAPSPFIDETQRLVC
jgi:hypothetical protein